MDQSKPTSELLSREEDVQLPFFSTTTPTLAIETMMFQRLFSFVVLASVTQAFSPQPSVTRSVTELNMGLFDAFQPPKKVKGGQEADVFAGRGDRITVREDEDNAMWVEEPGDMKKKGKKGKK